MYRGVKQKVMEQEMKNNTLIRTLTCGHLQAIRPGGKSKQATFAFCKECVGEMPVQSYGGEDRNVPAVPQMVFPGPPVTSLDPID